MNSPVFGEFFGTVVLILFGSGVGCSVNLKGTLAKGVGASWLYIAMGWGVAVMLGVLASGHFGSPGHLNPAVTIGFAVAGSFGSGCWCFCRGIDCSDPLLAAFSKYNG